MLERSNTDNNIEITEAKVLAVLDIAKKSFIPGKDYYKTIKEELRKNPTLAQKYRTDQQYPALKEKHQMADNKEQVFLWDTNRIPGTRFFAGSGPQSEHALKIFFREIVFNLNISHFVALGDVTAYDWGSHKDFYDYCLQERSMDLGHFVIEIKRLSGEVKPLPQKSEFIHQMLPRHIVKAQIKITEKLTNTVRDVNVTLFALKDGTSINLNPNNEIEARLTEEEKARRINERKAALWELTQLSIAQDIFVHCASGVGRTGHFIFLSWLVNNFQMIFGDKDNAVCAKKLLDFIDQIRKLRPALIYNHEQFDGAILNAYSVFRYAQENKKMNTEKSDLITPISIFPKLKNPSIQSDNNVESKLASRFEC